MNFELDKMDQIWRTFARISGMYYPRGQVFFGMQLPLALQRRGTAAALAKVREWHPRRILLSYGRCFETGAHDALGSSGGRA